MGHLCQQENVLLFSFENYFILKLKQFPSKCLEEGVLLDKLEAELSLAMDGPDLWNLYHWKMQQLARVGMKVKAGVLSTMASFPLTGEGTKSASLVGKLITPFLHPTEYSPRARVMGTLEPICKE